MNANSTHAAPGTRSCAAGWLGNSARPGPGVRRCRAAVLALLAWCAATVACAETLVPTPFSSAEPSGTPQGWVRAPIAFWKKSTEYTLTSEAATTVIRATARAAASGLIFHLDADAHPLPVIAWRWKVVTPPTGADNRSKDSEDASARVILEFDGKGDRRGASRAAAVAGALLDPRSTYGLLMYITSDRERVDTVIVHPRTDHVRMIVVGGANTELGRWSRFARDYRADFARAFGRLPGRLTAVGIMTDSDNTGSFAEAYFGDIRFVSEDELMSTAKRQERESQGAQEASASGS